jgi:hypothetical protein
MCQEVFVVLEELWYDIQGGSREIVDIFDTEEYANEISKGLNETNGFENEYSGQSYTVEKRVVKKRVVEITREMVQALREETGEGIMCCHKALRDSNGDRKKLLTT